MIIWLTFVFILWIYDILIYYIFVMLTFFDDFCTMINVHDNYDIWYVVLRIVNFYTFWSCSPAHDQIQLCQGREFLSLGQWTCGATENEFYSEKSQVSFLGWQPQILILCVFFPLYIYIFIYCINVLCISVLCIVSQDI